MRGIGDDVDVSLIWCGEGQRYLYPAVQIYEPPTLDMHSANSWKATHMHWVNRLPFKYSARG